MDTSTLQKIQKPVNDFLERFSSTYKEVLNSKVSTISEAVDKLNHSTGKRVRPMLVGLSACLCGMPPGDLSVEIAVTLELIHTSSLVHDDVIDASIERRAQPTLNAIYGNHTAVLVGDFMVMGALLRAISRLDKEAVHSILMMAHHLVEGELQQIDLVRKKTSNEAEYMEVIQKKTASLFAASCFLGAHSVKASEEMQQKCLNIGYLLGIAFQMRDDILDYTNTQTGKPRGNDLKEGKATLPILYALDQVSATEKEKILQLMQPPVEPQAVNQIIDFAIRNKGIEYTQQKIDNYIDQACEQLRQFPPSEAQQAMLELALFIGNRSH